jgi:hypothetical protein
MLFLTLVLFRLYMIAVVYDLTVIFSLLKLNGVHILFF